MAESKEEHNAPILRKIHHLEQVMEKYLKLLEKIRGFQKKVKSLDLSFQDEIVSPVGTYALAGNNEWRGTRYNTANDQNWADIKNMLSNYGNQVGDLNGDIADAIKRLVKMIEDLRQEIRHLKSSLW